MTIQEKETLIDILNDYKTIKFRKLGTCDLFWIENFIKKLKKIRKPKSA